MLLTVGCKPVLDCESKIYAEIGLHSFLKNALETEDSSDPKNMELQVLDSSAISRLKSIGGIFLTSIER